MVYTTLQSSLNFLQDQTQNLCDYKKTQQITKIVRKWCFQ
jgi:hypothetical protein